MKSFHNFLRLSLFLAAVHLLPISEADGENEEAGKSSWSYFRQAEWPKLFPMCTAERQSPINIQTKDVVVDNELQLKLIHYDETLQVKVKTSEYTLSATPNNAPQKPTVKLSWLSSEYELMEIHFHWGDGSTEPLGSEHLIDSVGTSAELHMVHLKKGLAKENIAGVDDALVVIGVFLKLGTITNREVANIVAQADDKNGVESYGWLDGSTNLLPLINQRAFYTYPGSLTSPPCQQVVTWIVMHSPISISQEKLLKLTKLVYSKDNHIYNIGQTYRSMVQPLNQRTVFMSNNVTQM